MKKSYQQPEVEVLIIPSIEASSTSEWTDDDANPDGWD